jgi:Domain of unknown function (DUF4389)
MSDVAMPLPTRRVDMWYAGVAPQNRWTVGFRIILAIPQLFVLLILGVVVFFVVVIGWFAALVTGRLPQWAHEFITSYIRWTVRVEAYVLLLTDQYPPFSLEDEAYPARPVLPLPGPLNRAAVLFRIFVAIPASVFSQIVWYGLTTPLIIGVWVVVLVRGSMPPSLYLPYAALVRYLARFHSWFAMLNSEYPWGMLGDRTTPATPPSSWVPPPAPPAPEPPAWPSSGAPAPPASSTGVPPPPYAYPTNEVPPAEATPSDAPEPSPGWPPPPPPSAAPPPQAEPGAMPPPSTWERAVPPPPAGGEVLPPWGTLVLEGAARGWMIFAIVWGSVVFVAQSAARAANNNNNVHSQYLGGRPTTAGQPPITR